MAPEVVLKHNHTTKSDMWRFGAMVFEMVTGKLQGSYVNSIDFQKYNNIM